jgi:hypothetical protein
VHDDISKRLFGNYEFIMGFDVIDYLNNEPMIRKLNEEKMIALATSDELQKRVEGLNGHVRKLELEKEHLKGEKKNLEEKLADVSRGSAFVVGFSFVGTIFAGIGANVATSNPSAPLGWILIAVATIFQIAVFILRPKKGSQ